MKGKRDTTEEKMRLLREADRAEAHEWGPLFLHYDVLATARHPRSPTAPRKSLTSLRLPEA